MHLTKFVSCEIALWRALVTYAKVLEKLLANRGNTVEQLIEYVLNSGGAGIGVSGLIAALYLHFKGVIKDRDLQRANERVIEAQKEQAAALANAERDKKLEIAQLKNELHEQRLNIQGEFLEKLGHTVDILRDSVSQLSADVRVMYDRRRDS